MELQGSCHCGAVKFQCKSKHPYPYQLCYCGVCRKTAGAGGYAINIAADANSLEVHQGTEHTTTYNALIKSSPDSPPEISPAQRKFCQKCGSQLWLYDPRWPELLHPHASAIDTELPVPPERTHIMLRHKASWTEPYVKPGDKTFQEYPDESIAEWHRRHGLEIE